MKNYPHWVCQECGSKASKKQFQVSTWHKDKCDVCEKIKMVTEARDFFYPEFEENYENEDQYQDPGDDVFYDK